MQLSDPGRSAGCSPIRRRSGSAGSPCRRCGSTEHGRPNIEWPPAALNHNLSGSGQHWLLALAAAGPAGVDIECRRGIDLEGMADACLTASERLNPQVQPDALRQSRSSAAGRGSKPW